MAANKGRNSRGRDKLVKSDSLSALYRTFANLAESLQSTLGQLPREAVHKTPTLVEAINELLIAKGAKGVRHRYLVQLRLSLCSFVDSVGDIRLDAITPKLIEQWLFRPEWGTHARRSYLIDLRTLLSFCVRREYLDRSPADAVETPRPERRAPAIHTPEQVAAVLDTARRLDLDVCRLLAVQYFAGVRPAEAARLTDADIRDGYVIVEAGKAKTRQRRLVPVEPALAAWLALGGSLPVRNRVRRYYQVREAAGVPWAHDVTRHTFCSYHLAHGKSAAVTALVAGHSETMLHAHYRALVSGEAAAAFWSIVPGISMAMGPASDTLPSASRASGLKSSAA